MDITTLAAANAYTDKKVGAGGGSGGGGLPVVELNAFPHEPMTVLSTEDGAKMDAMAILGTPIIATLISADTGAIMKIVFNYIYESDTGAVFMAHTGAMGLVFSKDGDTWVLTNMAAMVG